MKAAFFDHVGQPLRIDDLRDPDPAPDEVVVQFAACGICGSDLHMLQAPVRATRIPHAPVQIVPGVGHFATQKAPATVTVIGDFLAA